MTVTGVPSDAAENPAGYFPGAFLNHIEASLARYLPKTNIQLRPIRTEDSGNSIGIYSASWLPDQDSYEIGNGYGPTCNYYMIKIQNVVKSANETMGRALFTNVAKMIRVILVRDPDFRVALLGLTEEMLSTKERVSKFSVTRQDYLSTRIQATFLYLATTDLLIETETTFLPN